MDAITEMRKMVQKQTADQQGRAQVVQILKAMASSHQEISLRKDYRLLSNLLNVVVYPYFTQRFLS